jgi:hypothetical protein
MSDALTNYFVGRTQCERPCVIKYVPFGTLLQASICYLFLTLFPSGLTFPHQYTIYCAILVCGFKDDSNHTVMSRSCPTFHVGRLRTKVSSKQEVL